jgi:hypothetical protein
MTRVISASYLFTVFFHMKFHTNAAQFLMDSGFLSMPGIKEAQDTPLEFRFNGPAEIEPQVSVAVMPDQGRAKMFAEILSLGFIPAKDLASGRHLIGLAHLLALPRLCGGC